MSNILQNYLCLPMVKIQQFQSGIVFSGKITFGQLKEIYKLTERSESDYDPIEQPNFLDERREFQRHLHMEKINEIKRFVKENINLYLDYEAEENKPRALGIFPSSVILYNREYTENDINASGKQSTPLSIKLIEDSYTKDLDCCFYLQKEDSVYDLYIPRNEGITLIVDGQHRFWGLLDLFDELNEEEQKALNKFEFIATYLVGFDLFEVSEIFATVNFKQKPVNRSLYYDIFGSGPKIGNENNFRNQLKLSHDLVMHLNNGKDSPLYGMVKQLGRGKGFISQSFFVDKLLKKIFNLKIWDDYLYDYLNDGNEYRKIALFMKGYFGAIKSSYPSSWPKDLSLRSYSYILCKTTGFGAYIRLIKDIFPHLDKDKDFYDQLVPIMAKISDKEAEALFSKKGPYGGAGSEGLQDKLYGELKQRYGLNKA